MTGSYHNTFHILDKNGRDSQMVEIAKDTPAKRTGGSGKVRHRVAYGGGVRRGRQAGACVCVFCLWCLVFSWFYGRVVCGSVYYDESEVGCLNGIHTFRLFSPSLPSVSLPLRSPSSLRPPPPPSLFPSPLPPRLFPLVPSPLVFSRI